MNTQPGLRRDLAAGSLVATALLSGISLLTMPDWPDGFAALLGTIEEHPTTSLISALTFVLAQLPFLVAAVAIGTLVIPRKPVLGGIGATLAVVGGFGHTVYGGVAMTQLEMAADESHHAVHADVLTGLESSPLVAFMAMGLVGTVLGLLLLAIGLWRTRAVPTWIPAALGLFLVTEFVVSAITDWAAYASSVLYLAAFTGLVVAVWQRPAVTVEPAPDLVEAETLGDR
jgi:hypothetical protein